jgi:pyruvate kinase
MPKQTEVKRTKIIATVGPASNSKKVLTDLVNTGADVFRLNFSHGTHEDHAKVIEMVREINKQFGTNIGLLQDLQGPKIRVENVKKGVKIKAGETLTITTNSVEGDEKIVSTSYKSLPDDVQIGDSILIDDGKLELRVENIKGTDVTTRIIHGGKLKSRKGINLPNTNVSAPALTEKDEKDLKFGLENDVEWVALSFVRSPKDILDLKKKIDDAGKDTLVIAKIEKPEAIEHLDAIIKASDGIMVARGDLGVEIRSEEVPMLQKTIVEQCRKQAKPVIIATQMMESMIENPRPTRAETNDVANAVIDGADALMLSAETAAGEFPVEVIKSMVATIKSVESNDENYNRLYALDKESQYFINDSIVQMAARIANYSEARAIVGLTNKGYTAFKLSSYRPRSPIYIFTHNKPFLNTMNLIWGVNGIFYNKSESTDATMEDLENILKSNGYVEKGDVIVNLAAMPINEMGRVNAVKIAEVN